MKKTHLMLAVALLMAAATSAQTFTIQATIPGITAGCEVRLLTHDGHHTLLAKGTTADGGFSLSGEVARPTLVLLRISDKPQYAENEHAQDRGGQFMLGEGITNIRADHFLQVPRIYEYGGTPLKMERNLHIEGGLPQRHYQEWRNYIIDAELAAWQTDHVAWKAQFGNSRQSDEEPAALSEMKAAGLAAQAMVDAMNSAFVKAHPTYAISLVLQQQQLENMFAFSNDELDQLVTTFRDNEDQQGYKALCQQIEQLRRYTRGTPYTDLTLELPDGSRKSLSDYVKKGQLHFIDFWASWCGPCRAAIPSVKEMHRQWGDRVNILSISLDTNKEAWQQAMQQEQMPWTQLLVPRESSKALTDAYQVRAIPYLMIIDGDGRILLTTHSADEAQAAIEGRIGLRGER